MQCSFLPMARVQQHGGNGTVHAAAQGKHDMVVAKLFAQPFHAFVHKGAG
jgi:hypothetical protein